MTDNAILNLLKEHYGSFTELEKDIATYFTESEHTENELSADYVTQKLHVSKSALTRFAKKCDFKGYREFIYFYLSNQKILSNSKESHPSHPLSDTVFHLYQEILLKNRTFFKEKQITSIINLLESSKRVYFFGTGSSGLVAREMKLRLTRLGLVCEALTDPDSFAWTIHILDESCLVIGLSLSGTTRSVLEGLNNAKESGAKTVLISGQQERSYDEYDEIVDIQSLENLHFGQQISPQFPLLLFVDILYTHFLNTNREEKEAIFLSTKSLHKK